VGLYLTNSGPLTLAERWTGKGWHIQATPNPGQAYDIDPPAVACPTVMACIAVGGYTNNTPKLTFAEQWHGTGQSGLLPNSRSAAQGNSPFACPRALLFGQRHGWQPTPLSLQRWPVHVLPVREAGLSSVTCADTRPVRRS
jgi:hypothetical protein